MFLVHYLAHQRLEHNSNKIYNYRGRMKEAECRCNELWGSKILTSITGNQYVMSKFENSRNFMGIEDKREKLGQTVTE